MNTKPLDEVMQAATPGEMKSGTKGFSIGNTSWTPVPPGTVERQIPTADLALLAHYWNHFPKLVEALERMMQTEGVTLADDEEKLSADTDAEKFAREALAQAKQVQMP